MSNNRIVRHPILSVNECQEIEFFWQGNRITAHADETIASALIANGIHIFGHHHRDHSPQGIFCANGQCSQCMVIANGKPVKSCMELVKPGLKVMPADGLPELPQVNSAPQMQDIEEIRVPVLIIGGGPSGLSAAIELGKLGIEVILVDDKHRLGGKLVLQTHRFFGATNAVYAGTRGIDIATRLEKDVRSFSTIDIWVESTALAVFSDHHIGILRNGHEYILVKPQVVLVATGAREKFLAFRGNTLPGVFGAGAFQTLVNRDLIRPAEKLFIVGGGNVGLIAGYHALQAGIGVVGLVEALPECGGYKVHRDKLARMGVPIYTSHTILSANGSDRVESVTIGQVDANFHPIPGTEKSFACDSLLIAVGLDPVNEFYIKALEYGLPAFAAGDAEEIAEASAAIFSGKIKGLEIAKTLGCPGINIPKEWYRTIDILKSKPGASQPEIGSDDNAGGVVPIVHCTQEIPCDPCASVCPNGLFNVDENDIRSIPVFLGNNYCCVMCERCVAGCPGLAITLVDYRSNLDYPTVSIPYEFIRETISKHDIVTVMNTTGEPLGELPVMSVHKIPRSDRTLIIQVQAPKEIAQQIAGIKVQEKAITLPLDEFVDHIHDDTIICRCERVTAGEIRELIRQGYRDINEIKAISRAGMGACGSKTCSTLIHRLFREHGIMDKELVDFTKRPLFIEVSLSAFAGIQNDQDGSND
jgi:sarcosine oxidase, subunit alpha